MRRGLTVFVKCAIIYIRVNFDGNQTTTGIAKYQVILHFQGLVFLSCPGMGIKLASKFFGKNI
ncbi:MAG: hypothetical protein A3B95_01280 [Candidatus Doudnabacteria bacterium RIFCSPHIGHO2_02_FULL_43_13b]|nr:MAG: hypothetical protein A3B95_01280 [Candidatus Doudnabacteria bacterium RIFCSPHIGHO2_02_FULL_43_13b]